ncbi:hypothetical protein ANCDUO_09419 [Ancylostoma duodenale]|uniref:Uncharacterized protein n=1 Tax=Ancylostoma duodenale TaxID=51022 RepID=A0A0C2GMX1_9BILA|nr:hypothetical protein ANCDUO_09419 [Ancylostoma duodenale]
MQSLVCCRNGFRHLLLVLGFFCLTSVNSNYIIINFTFICMAKPLGGEDVSSADNKKKEKKGKNGIEREASGSK